MRRLAQFLDPFTRLGNTKYSFAFAFFANCILCILSELYSYGIAKNSLAVGGYIIFLNVGFIVYFAFRDGVLGGITSVVITLAYYVYIIYTRHYHGELLITSIETIVVLGFIYVLLAMLIGFLKQTLDKVIEREIDGRKRLETIIRQLPVGVLLTDKNRAVIQSNRQLEKILGDIFPTNLTIDESRFFSSDSDGKKVSSEQMPLTQALKGKTLTNKEYAFFQPNGKSMILQASAKPIKNHRGQIIAVVQVISDVTEQKELEQRKDDFINMASHEFKTPLTSIKAFTHVLQKKLKEKKDVESVALLSRVDAQLNKLVMLVSDLLDVTRLQKGKLKVQKEKFLVRELAEEIIHDLQPITDHKLQLKWTTHHPVFADKERIRQVLTNLVTNAIKYSPEKGNIIIGSRKAKKMIEIYVQDFGVGIAKSEQAKIFSRFYQVKGQSTYPGLGLGLYISSLIIVEHKGKMWVESKQNEGATFWFSLPIYKK